MNAKGQWDFRSASDSMLTNAKEHGLLPLDFDPSKEIVPEAVANQHQKAARRMVETAGRERAPVEDLLRDLFGTSYSSAVKRVLAENKGIVIPPDYGEGCFCCDLDSLPTDIKTIAAAAYL